MCLLLLHARELLLLVVEAQLQLGALIAVTLHRRPLGAAAGPGRAQEPFAQEGAPRPSRAPPEVEGER